ncbi:MAG: MmgE/PrpD family protein [Alphaproteobacteria bacterium]|nr:MmgE/PrpD family protein [Alphaproteobacteria bacterium]
MLVSADWNNQESPSMPAGLTQSFVDFIVGIRSLALPANGLATVRIGFTDCVGVMVAGLDEPVTAALAKIVAADGGKPEARVLLGDCRAPAANAAMVGSAAAHALDYDDWAFSCHPSAVLVPAIIAEAETVGSTGREMALAYLAGYEVWARLMSREPDHHYAKGWHPTSAFGPIGVAAAVAVLHNLDAATTRNALGIAASHGGGVMANFGTMTKPYHGGRSAQAGIVATRLAMAGVDASAQAIEAKNGLLFAVSPAGRVDLTTPITDLGVKWYVEKARLNVKRYPTVGASQRCADAAIQLHDEAHIDPTTIRRVVPRVSPRHAEVMPYHRPHTGLEAKFSLEAVVALGLLYGRVGLPELTDEVVARPAVQDLIAKVAIELSADDDPEFPNGARVDNVRVELAEGRVATSRDVRRHRGHGQNPLTVEELWQKFALCTAAKIAPAAARHLFDTLQRIDALSGTSAIPPI